MAVEYTLHYGTGSCVLSSVNLWRQHGDKFRENVQTYFFVAAQLTLLI